MSSSVLDLSAADPFLSGFRVKERLLLGLHTESTKEFEVGEHSCRASSSANCATSSRKATGNATV